MAEEVLTLWLLVALLASSGAFESSGGGGPLPPEVHHFKNAMSASLRMRGSFEEMVVSRTEIESLIVTFLVCWVCFRHVATVGFASFAVFFESKLLYS